MDLAVEPDWAEPSNGEAIASDRGAGDLGFAGTAHTDAVAAAAGLAALAGDGFGGGPRVPMMPGSWNRAGRPERDGRDAGAPRDD